jgi:O-antigen/teichoic acid export membrane protein
VRLPEPPSETGSSTRAVPDFLHRLLPRGVSTLASANLASQFIALGALPLLTRWYAVSDFGLLQIYLSITMVGGLVACIRYDYAVLQPPDSATAGRIVVLSLLIALVSGFLVLGLVPLLGWVFGTQGWRDLNRLALVVGAAVAFTGMASAVTNWLLRRGRFEVVARARLFQGGSMAGLQLAGALAGMGGTGLILGDALGRMVGLLVLLSASGLSRHLPRDRPALASLGRLGRDYLRFPLISGPSALVNSVGIAIPVLFLERFFGTAGLGVYSLLERVMGVPSLLVGMPLSQTFIHRLREAISRGSASIRSEVRSTVRIAALLGIAPFLALGLAGPFIFVTVFGEQWLATGELAQMLAVVYYVAYLIWPVNPTLTVMNRLRTQMAWDAGRGLTLAGVVCAVGLGHLPLEAMISMMTATAAVFGIVHYFLCLHSTQELCDLAPAS